MHQLIVSDYIHCWYWMEMYNMKTPSLCKVFFSSFVMDKITHHRTRQHCTAQKSELDSMTGGLTGSYQLLCSIPQITWKACSDWCDHIDLLICRGTKSSVYTVSDVALCQKMKKKMLIITSLGTIKTLFCHLIFSIMTKKNGLKLTTL